MTARVALDTNILVYAELEPASEKGVLCAELIRRSAERGVLALQVLLEFTSVIRRRRPAALDRAIAKIDVWRAVYQVAPTSEDVMDAALRLVAAHHFQVWDAVIWSASRAAGARCLFSEDMQDGLELGGLTVIDPFQRDMAELLELIGR